jgi:AcrR family transcriptional regulator
MNNATAARKRQAEERRAQLIDTALGVFAEKGVEGATVKELSAAAGVAQGLLYHYFRSKEDLLHAALERHDFLPELRRIASPDRDRPAREVLVEVGEGFAAMLREHRPLLQVMAREAPTNPAVAERVERARRESVRLLSEYLESRVAAGELRPHDVQTLGAVLVGGLGEALVGPLSARNGRLVRNEALVASLVQFCLNSLPTAEVEEAIA